MIAIFGTLFSDWIRNGGIPLAITTPGFLLILLVAFLIWYKVENSLDMQNINTPRREIFYWIVIFFTFALGTAAGDLLSGTFHLGYMDATIIFGVVMVVAPLVLYLLKINSVVLFWITYILTRPFGASGGDLLSHPKWKGGFGYGTGTTALCVLAVMILMIVYMTITHKKEMSIEERA